MNWFLSKLAGWLRGKRPKLVCQAKLWREGVAELERRTRNGRQESGAFLLGQEKGGIKTVLEFVFYDDIDPNALKSGIVHFAGNKLPRLWDICRARGYGVVADVHVHPGGYQQSDSDMANPVMPRAGHIALIIPHFARRDTDPGAIGLYEYHGNGRWTTHTRDGRHFFMLESSRP